MGKRGAVLTAFAAFAGGAWALHRLGHRSGATLEETLRELPGDELVRDPQWVATRAATIDAPPSAVWPWVVQMGFPSYRAGWYTPYWLDRLLWRTRARSSDVIVPELQELKPGDTVPDSIDWSAYFVVREVEPPSRLVLHSTLHKIKPIRTVDFVWAFVLEPLDRDRTRLLVRARANYTPAWAGLVVEPLIWLGDVVNVTVMLRGIRQRVETAARRS